MPLAQAPIKKPETYNDIVVAMRSLGLPQLRLEVAQGLSPNFRKGIADAIYQVMSKTANAENMRSRLQCVVTVFAPGAEKVFKSLGIEDLTPDDLYRKANSEGEALRGSLQSLIEQFDPDCADAEVVRRIFGAVGPITESGDRSPAPNPAQRAAPQRPFPQSGRPAASREKSPQPVDNEFPTENSRRQAAPASRGEEGGARELPDSFHVYAKSYALTVQQDYSDNQKMHTLRLEIAKSIGPRAYDWKGKVAVQLSRKELPLMLGVMTGKLKKLDANGHGEGNTKYFSFEDQGANWYFKMGIKDGLNGALPVLAEDCYRLIPMILKAMRRNDPVLESNKDVFDIVSLVCARYEVRAGGQQRRSD